MADIAITWDVAHSRGDISFVSGDVATGDDLASATLVSLFSDRLANTDDVLPDASSDRRGWWGDDASDPNGLLGSRLWLLDRSKQTDQVLRAARDYENQALQWMIDDGVAVSFEAYVEWTQPSLLGSLVTIRKSDGQRVALAYDWAWQQRGI